MTNRDDLLRCSIGQLASHRVAIRPSSLTRNNQRP